MSTQFLVCRLTESTVAAQTTLGQKVEVDGKVYRYVRFRDAVTYAAGQPVTWEDKNGWEVTNDVSDSEDSADLAGLALGVMTENYYGYIQTGGEHAAAVKLAGDDAIAAGTLLKAHGSTDAVLFTYANTVASSGNPTDAERLTQQNVVSKGYAIASHLSNDTADTVAVRLYCEA